MSNYHKFKHPYGVEIIADPCDVFAPGSIKHPLRPFFRWWFPRDLSRVCQEACAAAFVTKEALQRRYPCPNLSVGVSIAIPGIFSQIKPVFENRPTTLVLNANHLSGILKPLDVEVYQATR